MPDAPPFTPSARYPEEAFEMLDPSFARFRVMNSVIERLWTGGAWSEGPVWFGAHRTLLWSDIPNQRILRWEEDGGTVSVFRSPSNFANGNTTDRSGRLVTCEHGGRRVTRTEHDGRITVMADRFEGKRLNSPNDLVVKSDGSIWFTDPPFGIMSNYEGSMTEPELPHGVYRVDGRTRAIKLVAEGIPGPNGLAFSPDESILYIVASRAEPRQILACDVLDDGARLGTPRVLIQCAAGESPDGFRLDTEGNLWCGWGMGAGQDGVRVFNAAGAPLGHIHLPERCANLEFGGRHRNRLFMAASRSLYAVTVNATAAV
ncbi:gluconolactonase [Humitalea rosea]|uniref:Gluconolactonase n=1 Tax=Humitalea rosea TaxID=990373 RepID=A0A2W7IS98_9PROT|nr:SMP-30/gluconolactonase/LRE family protein [Humitalea rosea]PZW42317.1 gluconolactonase [Humitalea rosea]